MAFVFQRRLAIPLWALAFFIVALTAPPAPAPFMMTPTTVVAIAAVGIAAIVFLMPGAITRLRASRSLVRVVPSGYRIPAGPRMLLAAGTCVQTLHEANADADDTLDLVRMDDDGGWQMSRPPA